MNEDTKSGLRALLVKFQSSGVTSGENPHALLEEILGQIADDSQVALSLESSLAISSQVALLTDDLTALFDSKTSVPVTVWSKRERWIDLMLALGGFLNQVLPPPVHLPVRMALYELMRVLKDSNKGIPSPLLEPSPRPVAPGARPRNDGGGRRVKGAENPSLWWDNIAMVSASLDAVYQSRLFLGQTTTKPTFSAAAAPTSQKSFPASSARFGAGGAKMIARKTHPAQTIIGWRKRVLKPTEGKPTIARAHKLYEGYLREIFDGEPATKKLAAARAVLCSLQDGLLMADHSQGD